MLKQIVLWVLKAIYKYSGLQSLVDSIDLKITNYRLRLNIVPVTYKLFLIALGAAGMYGWQNAYILYKAEAQPIVIEQPIQVEIAQAQEIEPPKEKTVEEIADYIWNKESTKGKNNYSKCEAQGKTNGIGYGIPGNGKYMCFNNHEEEMQVLKGWIISHKAQGYTELEYLCIYSGHNYPECKG